MVKISYIYFSWTSFFLWFLFIFIWYVKIYGYVSESHTYCRWAGLCRGFQKANLRESILYFRDVILVRHKYMYAPGMGEYPPCLLQNIRVTRTSCIHEYFFPFFFKHLLYFSISSCYFVAYFFIFFRSIFKRLFR